MTEITCSLPTCGRERRSLAESGWITHAAVMVRLCPAHTTSDHVPTVRWVSGEIRVVCSCGSRIGVFSRLDEATNAYVTHLGMMNEDE